MGPRSSNRRSLPSTITNSSTCWPFLPLFRNMSLHIDLWHHKSPPRWAPAVSSPGTDVMRGSSHLCYVHTFSGSLYLTYPELQLSPKMNGLGFSFRSSMTPPTYLHAIFRSVVIGPPTPLTKHNLNRWLAECVLLLRAQSHFSFTSIKSIRTELVASSIFFFGDF